MSYVKRLKKICPTANCEHWPVGCMTLDIRFIIRNWQNEKKTIVDKLFTAFAINLKKGKDGYVNRLCNVFFYYFIEFIYYYWTLSSSC